jgi:hypothetical protein
MIKKRSIYHWPAVILLLVVIVIPVILACYWVTWEIFLFVMQGLWPDGPHSIVHVDFWVFVGLLFLLQLIFGAFRSK